MLYLRCIWIIYCRLTDIRQHLSVNQKNLYKYMHLKFMYMFILKAFNITWLRAYSDWLTAFMFLCVYAGMCGLSLSYITYI